MFYNENYNELYWSWEDEMCGACEVMRLKCVQGYGGET